MSDAQNLSIRLGIRLPESLVARAIITSDGSEAWAASESGMLYLPLGKLYEYPILQPETTQVFLAVDDCNRGIASARLKVNNLGGGRLTFAVPVTPNAVVVTADSGLAPSFLNFTMEPGRTGIARQPGTNLSFNGGMTGAPVTLDLISPEAINIPPRIRVYMNYRTNDMRGVIKPIPTILDNTQGLKDLVLDESRGKIYIANAGFNRIEVYDLKTQQLVEPIPVCQLPQQMALGTDGYTMYVACSGSEGIGIVDLDIGRHVCRSGVPGDSPAGERRSDYAANSGHGAERVAVRDVERDDLEGRGKPGDSSRSKSYHRDYGQWGTDGHRAASDG